MYFFTLSIQWLPCEWMFAKFKSYISSLSTDSDCRDNDDDDDVKKIKNTTQFCLLGSVLLTLFWMQSYLSSRFSQLKHWKSHLNHDLSPQGSVLGPLLSILCTTLPSSLIKASSVDHRL